VVFTRPQVGATFVGPDVADLLHSATVAVVGDVLSPVMAIAGNAYPDHAFLLHAAFPLPVASSPAWNQESTVSDNEPGIHHKIAELVQQERALRDQVQAGRISAGEERQQLRDVEEALDQCWDLLRQRDALRAVGKDPSSATARPVEQVENYRN
jgi:Protein of unknown function (DUF2630)